MALMGKKEKMSRKVKVFGIKTKVGYSALDINGKAKTTLEVGKNSWQSFFLNFKNVLIKPVRQVTHLGLVLMILIVLSTGLPAPEMLGNLSKKPVDPFGIRDMTAQTEASEKVTAVEAIVSITSVIDYSPEGKMFNDALQVADQQAARTTLAVAGESIAKLSAVTTVSSASGKASSQKYVVQGGDTLSGIAKRFGVTSDSIKWSNGMSDADTIKPGSELNIPSITGIIYTVKSGDTLVGIASKYKSQAALIESQNDLYGESLVAGMKIIIPDGVIDEPVIPRTQIASRYGSVPYYIATSSGPNHFTRGYCTWYVATRRYVPWYGDAHEWYYNARAYGRSVGKTPVAGAIMVTWESSWGHVAYVERVNGDGSFTVSEMNYIGYNRVSSRTTTTGRVPLIGFIY